VPVYILLYYRHTVNLLKYGYNFLQDCQTAIIRACSIGHPYPTAHASHRRAVGEVARLQKTLYPQNRVDIREYREWRNQWNFVR
jgi:hypothetical protein